MKIILLILSLINGGYMFADGLYVIVKGKYIGPEKPGPWANLFYKLNIDVLSFGPVFILYGLLWFIAIYGFWTNSGWGYSFGLIVAILTLWYLPAGTLISIVIIGMLLLGKGKLGF
jgi:hypothetical protein